MTTIRGMQNYLSQGLFDQKVNNQMQPYINIYYTHYKQLHTQISLQYRIDNTNNSLTRLLYAPKSRTAHVPTKLSKDKITAMSEFLWFT